MIGTCFLEIITAELGMTHITVAVQHHIAFARADQSQRNQNVFSFDLTSNPEAL